MTEAIPIIKRSVLKTLNREIQNIAENLAIQGLLQIDDEPKKPIPAT